MAKVNLIPLIPTEQEIVAFWARVRKGKTSECWPYLGPPYDDLSGYGLCSIRCRTVGAHRLAFTITEHFPGPLFVLHHCDNKRCVNPKHLFLGTQADNIADKVSKNRQARGDGHGLRLHPERRARGLRNGAYMHPEAVRRGESNSSAKVTADTVRMIRARYIKGIITARMLGDEYGLSETNVLDIVKRRIWRHIS